MTDIEEKKLTDAAEELTTKELIVSWLEGGVKGSVEVTALSTLADVRCLILEEFDEDMLPSFSSAEAANEAASSNSNSKSKSNQWVFVIDGIRISSKQESKRKAWKYIDSKDIQIKQKSQNQQQKAVVGNNNNNSSPQQLNDNNMPSLAPSRTVPLQPPMEATSPKTTQHGSTRKPQRQSMPSQLLGAVAGQNNLGFRTRKITTNREVSLGRAKARASSTKTKPEEWMKLQNNMEDIQNEDADPIASIQKKRIGTLWVIIV